MHPPDDKNLDASSEERRDRTTSIPLEERPGTNEASNPKRVRISAQEVDP